VGGGLETLQWRSLMMWEAELHKNLINDINHIQLKMGMEDRWLWKQEQSQVYMFVQLVA